MQFMEFSVAPQALPLTLLVHAIAIVDYVAAVILRIDAPKLLISLHAQQVRILLENIFVHVLCVNFRSILVAC